ncbi:mitochondrial inner membrane protease subunit 1 isoform X1 [Punica granatum]|uniref:Mitochondrial inner membrane protease subunit 1 isoform X1 n=1 Tax=Punica granatum TaxID=22663 RepID=A0A6P8BZF4_PUNGR|nr:mitochondrial inner membrane protease subunit 1 isoform X1 [Punica granatum]
MSLVTARWKSIAKEAVERAAIMARFLCLLHVTDAYLFSSTLVYGPSMFPTLNLAGDVLIVERVSHRRGKVGPGDVVLVKSPVDPRKTITKRIIGVGGDWVTFPVGPGNGDRSRSVMGCLGEAMIRGHCHLFLRVPKGHVWIQGDNMYASTDSRNFGPVPYGLILGKVFCRVWPPEGFGSISH